ncbi:alpha/beta fold hydrolase [Amycolatopsis saalfeldensis]|uniref:Pimeloyl-ACP methyl ester carboxylesterase n=1 Tax=Amycolatopsis saalfeldensis TaxID=394193 RepID=A0A1H8U401_9PSEU|nr:alpha/beta fold hydrolase [Amycolatopsis saalfeldensis]SEO97573.1 Pimeloyl-ACP methyl ester carboxylesterase [Amycolatopsis saalfeldensis]
MTASATTSRTRTIDLADGLSVTVHEFGENTDGQAVLVLHGGAGPRSVAGLATAMSEHVYTVAPIHPGFDGTPRPEWADSYEDLAWAYLDLLDRLDLNGVMVIGNSLGGQIATEMALRDTRGRVGCLVLLNASGPQPDDEADIVDIRTIPPLEIGGLSFANAAFRPDMTKLTDEQRAGLAANQKTQARYAGENFLYDPKIRRRLHRVTMPVLVVWGEQDGIFTARYGRTYADAFPNSRFVPVEGAGHFPQIEQLGATLGAIGDFVDTVVKPDENA